MSSNEPNGDDHNDDVPIVINNMIDVVEAGGNGNNGPPNFPGYGPIGHIIGHSVDSSTDDDDDISINVEDSDESDISDLIPLIGALDDDMRRNLAVQNIEDPERARLLQNPVATTLGDSSEVKRETGELLPENKDIPLPTQTFTSSSTKPGLPERLKQCNLCKAPGDLACGGCFYVVYCCAEHQLTDWKNHYKPCCYYSLHRGSSIVYQGPFHFRTKSPDASGFLMEASCNIEEKTVISEEIPFFVAPWPRLKIRKSETPMIRGLRPLCLTCFGCCKMLQFDFRTCCTCNIPICSDDCPFISKHRENECQYLKKMQCSMGQPDKFDVRTEGASLMDEQATELLYLDTMILRFILLHNKLQQECGDNEKWNEKWARLTTTWKISDAKRRFHSRRGRLISSSMEATLPLSYFATKGNNEVMWNIFCILEENMLLMDLPFRRLKVLCNATINARHSCVPNSHAYLKHDEDYNLDNLVMAIVSGESLLRGEAITISYCPLILPTVQRQPFIMEQYLFWCQCSRCVDPSECNTYTSSLKCTVCSSGYLKPPPALSKNPELMYPASYKYPVYNWSCGNTRCESNANCSSYENSTASSTHKAMLSSAVLLPKLERLELESVGVLGSYQKSQRFIQSRLSELHPNSHIFLKLYDDILKGALFPIVGDEGENLADFSVEWLKTLSRAKDAYTKFMKEVCPGFDYQGFPEVNHMLMEMEYYKLSDSNIISSSVSVTNLMDDIGSMLLRPTAMRPMIRGLRHYIEIRRPRISGSAETGSQSTVP